MRVEGAGGQGDAAEAGAELSRGTLKGERNQPGAGRDQPEAEPAGQAVREVAAAELRPAQAAAGDHHRAGAESAGVGEGDGELVGSRALDRADLGVGLDVDPGVGALGGEEVDDVARGAVAEKLAEGFLVVGDSVALDEVDEILWGIAREGAAAEGGLLGEVIFRGGVLIGEVAATTAADEDLLTDALGAFQDADPAAPLTGGDGAQEARRARAEDDHVVCGKGGGQEKG